MKLTPLDEIKDLKKMWDLNSLENKKKGLRMIEEQFSSDAFINGIGLFTRMGALGLMGLTATDSLNITDLGFYNHQEPRYAMMPFAVYLFGCLISTIVKDQSDAYKKSRDYFIRLDRS